MRHVADSVIQLKINASVVRRVTKTSRDDYLQQQRQVLMTRLQQLQQQATVTQSILVALEQELMQVEQQLSVG